MACGDDEIPRMRDPHSVREKQQVDRLLDDCIGPDLDERTVVHERRIERRECVLLERRDLADVAIYTGRTRLDRAGETGHAYLVAKRRMGRKIFREYSIHEHHRVPATFPEVEAIDVGFLDHRSS